MGVMVSGCRSVVVGDRKFGVIVVAVPSWW
jgi:hypothetical protein